MYRGMALCPTVLPAREHPLQAVQHVTARVAACAPHLPLPPAALLGYFCVSLTMLAQYQDCTTVLISRSKRRSDHSRPPSALLIYGIPAMHVLDLPDAALNALVAAAERSTRQVPHAPPGA